MGHLFSGVVLVGLGIWGMFAWWDSFGMVMRGFAPFALLSVGLVAMVSGLFRSEPPSRRQGRADEPASRADEPASGTDAPGSRAGEPAGRAHVRAGRVDAPRARADAPTATRRSDVRRPRGNGKQGVL